MRSLREKLADILRAECTGQDLVESEDGRLIICGLSVDGTLYKIGCISYDAILSQSRESIRRLINFKLNVRHPSAFKNAKLVSSPARFLVNYSGGYIP